MNKVTRYGLAGLVLFLIAIQLIPLDRTNPPVEMDMPAPPEVKSVLRRACYDCHSNETAWPWYSRVAPVSWLVAWDVKEGRDELNFSTWNRYSADERAKKIRESWEEVAEGEMPPWFYIPLHLEARLSEEDRHVLRSWAGPMRDDHREDD